MFSQAYVLDTASPTNTVATVSLIDSVSLQTVSGTLASSLAAGEAVYVSLDNGTTWTAASATVGSTAWSLVGVTLAGTNTLKAKVTDLAGNDGAAYSQAYTVLAISAEMTNQAVNDTAVINPFSSLVITDPATESVTVTVTLVNAANRGTFSTASTTGWTSTLSGNDIVLNRTFAAAANVGATVQSALHSITFAPRENVLAVGTTETTNFSVSVTNSVRTVTSANISTVTTGVYGPPIVSVNLPLNLDGTSSQIIATSLLHVTDADVTANHIVYTLGATPDKGTLLLSGAALSAGGQFTQADIDAGRLTYHATEPASTSFSFTVSDGVGGSIAPTTFAIASMPATNLTQQQTGQSSQRTVQQTTQPSGQPPVQQPAQQQQPVQQTVQQPPLPPVPQPVGTATGEPVTPQAGRYVGLMSPDAARATSVPLLAQDVAAPVSIITGQTIAFNLPPNTFIDANAGARLTVQASLTDGRPLPTWLSFNEANGSFQGTPPPGFTGVLNIQVVARDENGNSATAKLQVQVNAAGTIVGDAFARPVKPVAERALALPGARTGNVAVVQRGHEAKARPSFNQQMQHLTHHATGRTSDLIAHARALSRART